MIAWLSSGRVWRCAKQWSSKLIQTLTQHRQTHSSPDCRLQCVTKNDTDTKHINQFWQFLAEMLPREYAIRFWFVIPPLITNVSALPGETWTRTLEIMSSSVMLYTVSRKQHCFGLLYLRHSSTNFNNFFVDNNVVLFSTVQILSAA